MDQQPHPLPTTDLILEMTLIQSHKKAQWLRRMALPMTAMSLLQFQQEEPPLAPLTSLTRPSVDSSSARSLKAIRQLRESSQQVVPETEVVQQTQGSKTTSGPPAEVPPQAAA